MLCYLPYALNHCNPIVRTFASHIALSRARSPMCANVALLRHFYDVSFDRKLRINEQSICKVCKLPNESEQDAVGVMRDLLNCRDGIGPI